MVIKEKRFRILEEQINGIENRSIRAYGEYDG